MFHLLINILKKPTKTKTKQKTQTIMVHKNQEFCDKKILQLFLI